MYDATQPLAIPSDAVAVAGYDDGTVSRWPASAWNLWSDATTRKIHVCTYGPRHHGNCLDVERYDSTPSDIPDWADNAIARGVAHPIIYCGLSAWAACRKAAGKRPVLWWIANPTGVPHIPAGADACQYGWAGGYDTSLCEPWFGA